MKKKCNKKLPESAGLDHTKVRAPYVRLAGVINVDKKNKIYKYDIRFVQPNTKQIPTKILHSLEHLLAVTMRSRIDNIVDISPMGCLTGFYLVSLNQPYEKILKALEHGLVDLQKIKQVPFANKIQCGSAKLHDLPGAKEFAKIMLKDNFSNVFCVKKKSRD